MLEIDGIPMLEHILLRAIAGGTKFFISVHYLGEMIENYFSNGDKYGVTIEYLREESPLGTAGCLSLLKTKPDRPFIVTNGDVLTDIQYDDLLDFHRRQNAFATMAVRQHEIQNQFGVVKIKGVEYQGFEEKPIYRSYVNAGIYVLSPDALTYLKPNQPCDMPDLFNKIKDDGKRVLVYPMHEPWLDVGRPEDLVSARINNT